ncbi:MAG: Gfo/Idh/MocA family oxidoreductase [Planctomycetaceae bacterium]|nr:Gfo/Idh/MocA family oxidoreductase [Planctomycetaceae bacterium]
MSDQVPNSDSMNFTRRDVLSVSGPVAVSLLGGLTIPVGCAYSEQPKKTIRLGVVGGGFGTSFYWHQHPHCKVTGVTDLRPDRRQKLIGTYQCGTVYDSLEEMAERATDIDAVAVFSAPLDHVKHAKLCMERGWHVISAVPACWTLEEAEILKEVVERTGLTYMMAETSYYRQPTILARQLFQDGILGRLFYTEGEYYHDRGDLDRLISDKTTRFYDRDGSRTWRWGIPPMHYPTHSTGFLVGVTGERITRVSCLGWGTDDHPYVTENQYDNPYWNMSALMQTDQGNMFRCNVFWLCSATDERAQWFGDKATLQMAESGVHQAKLLFRSLDDRVAAEGLPPLQGSDITIPAYWRTDMLPPAMRHPSGHDNSHTFLTAEFINALVDERRPAIDLYDALAMTVPGIVAEQSAYKDGEQLPVPQFARPAE